MMQKCFCPTDFYQDDVELASIRLGFWAFSLISKDFSCGYVESTSVSALGNAQIPQSTSFCGLAGVTHSLGEDVVKCGVASLGLLSNVTWLIHLGSLGRPGHPCGVCGGVSSRAKSPTIVQLVRYRRVTGSLSLHAIDTQVCNC